MTPEFRITRKMLFSKERWYVQLVAANGKVVASNRRPYNTYWDAQEGCEAIKRAAAEAKVPGR